MTPVSTPKFERCILHIGSGKTGTSSLQTSFFTARKYLATQGYFYPNNGENHIFLASRFRTDPREIAFHARYGRVTLDAIHHYDLDQMQRLEKDLTAFDGHTVIFSSEYFPPGSEQDCKKLRDYLHTWAKEIQVVCYVRHPVSHAVSRSQQSLKMGFSTLDRPKETFFSPQKILPKFVRVFGKDAVTVRMFERDALQNGSVVSDFAALIGLSDDQQAHLQDKRGNESLSVEGALLSDALTRQFPRMVDGKWNPDRAQKITMMNIPGKKFTLPRSVLEGIMEECQPDIDYLQNAFGLTLKAPDLPASDTLAPTWGQGTIDSIAARMNAAELRIQHLEAELALKDGMLLAREDKPLKAIEKFKQSVALKQDNWPAISRLVHHLCRTRQKEEAAKRLAAYRDMNPDEERVLAICEKYGLQLPA